MDPEEELLKFLSNAVLVFLHGQEHQFHDKFHIHIGIQAHPCLFNGLQYPFQSVITADRTHGLDGRKLILENQKVYVDGTLIDEPYVSSELKEGNTEIPSVIPKGKVFVMGDNRLDSLDSRYSEIGLIDEENIIGKAQFVILPITRIQYLY